MSNESTTILTSSNVENLNNKHIPSDIENLNLTQTTESFQSQPINRTTVTPSQVELVKKSHAENMNKQRSIKLSSITPIGNNCIIKVKIRNALIHTPGSKVSQGQVEWIQLYRTSKRLKETMSELVEGQYCNVNLQLLLRVGGAPCYEEKIGNDEYIYFKISSEQIEYLYELV